MKTIDLIELNVYELNKKELESYNGGSELSDWLMYNICAVAHYLNNGAMITAKAGAAGARTF